MYQIAIMGSGNVAYHLSRILSPISDSCLIWSRDTEKAKALAKENNATHVSQIRHLFDVDIIFIATSDSAIPEMAKACMQSNALIVHTSGISEMSVIPLKRRGVYYPLQTLTFGFPLPPSQIPILIEAEAYADQEILKKLATQSGSEYQVINTASRQHIHLAAVFVNNFTNHLYGIAHHILQQQSIDMHILKPLMLHTVEKALDQHPFYIQTGPARRADSHTLHQHLDLLRQFAPYRQLYEVLSNSISSTYKNKPGKS